MSQPHSRRKLVAFIDGFNLYYGSLKDRPDLKWLDLRKMVAVLFPNDEIMGVTYFTARVDDDGRSTPSEKRMRQDNYCRALASVDVEVVDGRLEYREKECLVSHCALPRPCFFRIPVEKMTDVNMALHMVEDVVKFSPNVAVVISGDTDLIPAMQRVRRLMPKGLKQAFIPCSEKALKFRRTDEYGLNGWVARRLGEDVLRSAQFPPMVTAKDGTLLHRPTRWAI